jgi:hypothetical protein
MQPVSQKVVNRTISDHLPTKFATVSQNLSECFFTISDFRLVVVKSSLCGGMKIDQFTRATYLSDKFIYPALVLFEESNQRLATITFIYLRSRFHDPCGPQSIQLPNCLKIAETSVVLNVFKEASSVTSALTLLPFLYVAKQESTTRKVILWVK